MTKRAPIRYFRSASSLLPAMLLALSLAATAQAQWTTQTIQLQAGWNAVYLEVQPEPRECDAVLAGLPVESVWRWNKRFSTVEYIDDPNTLLPSQPDWLVHLPAQHPLAGQTTLYTMDGGRSYLIKLVDGSGPVTWNVKGKVVVRPVDWIGDSLNFVGFTLPTGGTPPTYQAFFTGSPAHANQPIYRLNTAGFWQLTTASNPMKRGESFWIRCQGRSTFQGPITVGLAKRTGLDYGQDLVEETINVRNSSSLSQTVQIKRLDSATPPPEAAELLAGQVPLRYWKPAEPSGDDAGWKPLPSILSKTLAPGQEWEVKLEVRRAEMSGSTTANAKHQSLVEVTDSANLSRSLIPVTAETVQSSGAGGVHSRAGLWVGHAEITHVNQPSSTSPETPLPVANPFTFRLLIHVSGSGDARLLQRVLQMWKSGTYSISRLLNNGLF